MARMIGDDPILWEAAVRQRQRRQAQDEAMMSSADDQARRPVNDRLPPEGAAPTHRPRRAQDDAGYPIPRRTPPAPGAVPVENTREPTPAGREAKPHSPRYHSRDAKKPKERR